MISDILAATVTTPSVAGGTLAAFLVGMVIGMLLVIWIKK